MGQAEGLISVFRIQGGGVVSVCGNAVQGLTALGCRGLWI